MHLRTQIRNWAFDSILDKTLAGDRVYKSRIIPFEDTFPVISIYTLTERVGEILKVNPPREREVILELEFEVVLKANTDYDTVLDFICQQIEGQIGGQPDIDFVESCDYAGTSITFDGSAELVFAIAKIQYDVVYLQKEGALPTSDEMDDLKSIYLNWDMYDLVFEDAENQPDGQIDAIDHIELEQE